MGENRGAAVLYEGTEVHAFELVRVEEKWLPAKSEWDMGVVGYYSIDQEFGEILSIPKLLVGGVRRFSSKTSAPETAAHTPAQNKRTVPETPPGRNPPHIE